ncbi:Uncharacterised protein [Achromobacter xylosoxidans]|uniref:hypothetical protein n=1 Tax=Alcaligenes xylosoxydans xylosoxydans TaxID=85698 RepID=UPI0006C29284|nr:hypothetical protein [Achromobacter xylosoxidans]CUJ03779.1 Uncharacterised protein [Achromobacter xylosoxidans]
MCSHYQTLKDAELLLKKFGAPNKPAGGKYDMWPRSPGVFIRRPVEHDAGDEAVPADLAIHWMDPEFPAAQALELLEHGLPEAAFTRTRCARRWETQNTNCPTLSRQSRLYRKINPTGRKDPASYSNIACHLPHNSIRVWSALTVVSNDENHGEIQPNRPYSVSLTHTPTEEDS